MERREGKRRAVGSGTPNALYFQLIISLPLSPPHLVASLALALFSCLFFLFRPPFSSSPHLLSLSPYSFPLHLHPWHLGRRGGEESLDPRQVTLGNRPPTPPAAGLFRGGHASFGANIGDSLPPSRRTDEAIFSASSSPVTGGTSPPPPPLSFPLPRPPQSTPDIAAEASEHCLL